MKVNELLKMLQCSDCETYDTVRGTMFGLTEFRAKLS